MHGHPDAGRLAASRHGMAGQAAEHGNAAAAARQQHHPCGAGFGVQHFGQAVAVQFRGDIEIMHAMADAGAHQDAGGAGERPRAVEKDGHAMQRAVDRGLVVERKDAIFHTEAGSERRQRRLIAPGEYQRRAGCRGVLRRHAAGIAGRAIDHQFFHIASHRFSERHDRTGARIALTRSCWIPA